MIDIIISYFCSKFPKSILGLNSSSGGMSGVWGWNDKRTTIQEGATRGAMEKRTMNQRWYWDDKGDTASQVKGDSGEGVRTLGNHKAAAWKHKHKYVNVTTRWDNYPCRCWSGIWQKNGSTIIHELHHHVVWLFVGSNRCKYCLARCGIIL